MFDQKKIIEAMADHLGLSPADIDKQSTLREDLGLGPIELNDLIADLSVQFDITLDPEEVPGVQTVEDLLVLIEDNML